MAEDAPIGSPDQNELVIALVAAVGTDVDIVADELAVELSEFKYGSKLLRLSGYLAEEFGQDFFATKKFDEALWDAMTVGDTLRNDWKRGDALVLHAISDIVAMRNERTGADDDPCDACGTGRLGPGLDRFAFILRSLKTQDELATLRAVYGSRLVVIAAYSPKAQRIKHLARQIAASRGTRKRADWVRLPEALGERDEKEERTRGQDVSGTFHRADFFIRGWNRKVVREDVRRTLEILFGSPFRTPTRDEHGQFLAAGAALRSAEFGRQVGAAITTPGGSVIAVGTNEVPTYGGGSHWEEDGKGNRDFEVGDIDTNRQQFDALAQRLAGRIDERTREIIRDAAPGDGVVADALEVMRAKLSATLPDDLRSAGLKDLTEFGRAVHAEMNALLDADRRGSPCRTPSSTRRPSPVTTVHGTSSGRESIVWCSSSPTPRAGPSNCTPTPSRSRDRSATRERSTSSLSSEWRRAGSPSSSKPLSVNGSAISLARTSAAERTCSARRKRRLSSRTAARPRFSPP